MLSVQVCLAPLACQGVCHATCTPGCGDIVLSRSKRYTTLLLECGGNGGLDATVPSSGKRIAWQSSQSAYQILVRRTASRQSTQSAEHTLHVRPLTCHIVCHSLPATFVSPPIGAEFAARDTLPLHFRPWLLTSKVPACMPSSPAHCQSHLAGHIHKHVSAYACGFLVLSMCIIPCSSNDGLLAVAWHWNITNKLHLCHYLLHVLL